MKQNYMHEYMTKLTLFDWLLGINLIGEARFLLMLLESGGQTFLPIPCMFQNRLG